MDAGSFRRGKTADGERSKETFDLTTREWRPSEVVELPDDLLHAEVILFDHGPLDAMAWAVMGGTLLYAADLIPQISDDAVNIDNAIPGGFGWR